MVSRSNFYKAALDERGRYHLGLIPINALGCADPACWASTRLDSRLLVQVTSKNRSGLPAEVANDKGRWATVA
jgi:hypothetical protein